LRTGHSDPEQLEGEGSVFSKSFVIPTSALRSKAREKRRAIGVPGDRACPERSRWIDNSSMADRDPPLTVDKNGQRHFSQMARINKTPTTSITAQATPCD
jgi:hypothetical protein